MEDSAEWLSQAAAILVLLVVLGFLAFMLWHFRSESRKAKARKQRLAGMGFTAVDPPDAAISERILALHQRRPKQRLELRNVWLRPGPEEQVYLLDLDDTGGDETTSLAVGMAAIISPALSLPYFYLLPKPNLEGKTAGFMVRAAEKFFHWAASQSGLERFSFPEYPEFDQRFMVMGRDETALRQFFRDDLPRQLGGMERVYEIAGGGDTFTLERQRAAEMLERGKDHIVEENIELLLGDARKILYLFQ